MAQRELPASRGLDDVLHEWLCEPWSWSKRADVALLVYTASSLGAAVGIAWIAIRLLRGTL